MGLTIGLTIAVYATATLSGIFGMAGGMVLMAILVLVIPVSPAMVIHGIAQGVSSGSRAWILRAHIVWSILPWYVIGASLAVTAFLLLALVPDRALILIAIGLFPWLGRLIPALRGLNVEHPPTAIVSGFIVTAGQLLAGASGPLLDLFYLNTSLSRFQIIATKAVTQTVGHGARVGSYGWLGTIVSGFNDSLLALAVLTIPAAVLGARTGTWILGRLSEGRFRSSSQWLILALGTVCVVMGLADLGARASGLL